MKFHELQWIKCPNRQSFEDHLEIWDHIQEIAQKQKCSFLWKVLNQEDNISFNNSTNGFSLRIKVDDGSSTAVNVDVIIKQ